jgi:hypothetical protein
MPELREDRGFGAVTLMWNHMVAVWRPLWRSDRDVDTLNQVNCEIP